MPREDIAIFSDEEAELAELDSQLETKSPSPSPEPIPPPPKEKRGRHRKGVKVSPEHREILLANLAKGREKALETRRKNAQLRKIDREEKMNEKEEKLLSALQKKKNKTKGNEDLLSEIAELKKQIKKQQLSASPPPPKEVPPPKPKEKTPPPPPSPKVEATPTPTPTPQPKGLPPPVQLSARELSRLMRSKR